MALLKILALDRFPGYPFFYSVSQLVDFVFFQDHHFVGQLPGLQVIIDYLTAFICLCAVAEWR